MRHLVSEAPPSACGSVSLLLYYHICKEYCLLFFSVPYSFSPLSLLKSFIFSNTLSFVTLGSAVYFPVLPHWEELGFLVITFPLETLPHTHTGNSGGQVQGFSFLRNAFFTIRSSREWKVMMQNLPPGFSRSISSSSAFFSTSSS